MALKRELTLLAPEVATAADRSSSVQPSESERGLALRVGVANAAAFNATPRLEWRSPDGVFQTVWTAAAAIVANGQFTYLLYPGGGAAGGWTEAVDLVLPARWRIVLAVAAGAADTEADASTLL